MRKGRRIKHNIIIRVVACCRNNSVCLFGANVVLLEKDPTRNGVAPRIPDTHRDKEAPRPAPRTRERGHTTHGGSDKKRQRNCEFIPYDNELNCGLWTCPVVHSTPETGHSGTADTASISAIWRSWLVAGVAFPSKTGIVACGLFVPPPGATRP